MASSVHGFHLLLYATILVAWIGWNEGFLERISDKASLVFTPWWTGTDIESRGFTRSYSLLLLQLVVRNVAELGSHTLRRMPQVFFVPSSLVRTLFGAASIKCMA